MEKKLSEINRAEWIAFRWIEIEPAFGADGDDRVFMAQGKRTPDEAAQAADDWDSTMLERNQFDGIEP